MVEAARRRLRQLDRPVVWALAAGVGSLVLGLVMSGPRDMAFVVSAETRALSFEWPCPGQLIDWTLPRGPGQGTLFRTTSMPDYAPLGWTGASGKIQLLPGALVEVRLGADGAMLIAVRRSGRAGQADSAIAEVFPERDPDRKGDSASPSEPVGVADELFLKVPPGSAPVALPIRGIVRLGGVLLDGQESSDILEGGTILARGEPLFADETRTFLSEGIGPGSLIYSHPELEPEPGQSPVAPAGGWTGWCKAVDGTPARHAVGLLQFNAGNPPEGAGPLQVAYIRHGPAVGLQTLGAAVPDDGEIVRLSVTRWAHMLSSSWAQTALIALAAALTLLNYLYQADGRPLLRKPWRRS